MTFLLSRKGIVHKFTFIANVSTLVVLAFALSINVVTPSATITLNIDKVLTIKAVWVVVFEFHSV